MHRLKDEGQMESYLKEASRMHEAGNDLAAVALLTQALTQGHNRTEALRMRAMLFHDMGCLKEAEDDVDLLFAEGESQATEDLLLLKAVLRLAHHDIPSAITYYNKAKERHPLCGQAYVGLSTAYSERRQLDLALSVMDEALRLLPDFAEGYKERGRIRFMLHDRDGAMDDLKQALRLSPETGKDVEGLFTNLSGPEENLPA